MLGLKASTEKTPIQGNTKKKYVLFYYKNKRISRGLNEHKTYRAFSLSVSIINSVQRRQRQSERH